MIPQRTSEPRAVATGSSQSEEPLENDVRYRIDACRKRLRSRRAAHRAEHQDQIDVGENEDIVSVAPDVESFAEILATVSMNQSSIARLVECLLGPDNSPEDVKDELGEREEAAIT
jgi:hypothetical protein